MKSQIKSISSRLNLNSTVIYLFIIISLSSCTDFIAEPDLENEWLVIDNDTIVLHFRPKNYTSAPSPTLTQARSIVDYQQFYYYRIRDSIRTDFRDKVLIYLYNKDEAQGEIGTDGGGHSIPKLNTFYYTFITSRPDFTDHFGKKNPYIGAHELVHVITHRSLGYPGTKLLSEGYANWLDGSYGRREIIQIVQTYRDEKPENIMSPDQLLFESIPTEAVYYPNCGVFTRFLVSEYGIETINNLFTVMEDDFINEFEQITSETWDVMSDKYDQYIESL